MPTIATQHFGTLEYRAEDVIEFPRGLPGFENSKAFLPLEIEEHRPLMFLQALEDAGPCFMVLPAQALEPGYRLELSESDMRTLGSKRRPRIGGEVMCLAVVTADESGVSANLLAPLVVNLANRRGVQAIQAGSGYSHRQRLAAVETPVCC
ncbi:MAG: flagellar assembly protein FliW [Bryobacteraceae bacterium]